MQSIKVCVFEFVFFFVCFWFFFFFLVFFLFFVFLREREGKGYFPFIFAILSLPGQCPGRAVALTPCTGIRIYGKDFLKAYIFQTI